MREVEVKYRVTDVEALYVALKKAGVVLGQAVWQDDQAYAPEEWSPGDPRVGVAFARLRTVDDQHVYTVKCPVENSLSCREFETPVADRQQMHQAVVAMGYKPTAQVTKTRQVGHFGDVAVCVDAVEQLGTFVELERIVADQVDGAGVQQELDQWARSWSVDLERCTDTYDSLVRGDLT